MFDRAAFKNASYGFFKNILFRFSPETAHYLSLKALQIAHYTGLSRRLLSVPVKWPVTLMGLTFSNPVGLVTPKPQAGNVRPRLIRLPHHEAIINRMGFNNKGCDYVVNKLKQTRYRGVLGVNIGKNFFTPIEQASDDYVYVFRRVAAYASYVTLNISSPNTRSLRELQHGDRLRSLLQIMKQEQQKFADQSNKYVPLLIKIAPDLSDSQLQTIAEAALAEKIDGIIATNTTLSRAGVEQSEHAAEPGGLSGKPLTEKSTVIIAKLHHFLKGNIPIIASGGVGSAQDVREKLKAGAQLVQLYSGLVYRGPSLVAESIECFEQTSSSLAYS
jgi:dihydroorotate dehydrogenase